MDDDIHILFSCDDKYAAYLSVVIISIIKNTNRKIYFHVVCDNVLEESKEKLKPIIANSNASIEFITCPTGLIDHLPVGSWHKSIYVKFLAPQLFPGLGKIIWLDIDILVTGDIGPLWDINMDSYALAAVAEDTLSPIHPRRHKHRLNLPDDSLYFNAGVLLINLDYWRKNHIFEKIVKFLQQEKNLIFFEQDALNVVLQKQIFPLDCRFNFFPFSEPAPEIIKQIGNPIILHFIVKQKPWLYKKIPFFLWSVKGYEFVDMWWQYARLSPWKLNYRWRPYLYYYSVLLVRQISRKLENFVRKYIRTPLAKIFTS